MDFAVAGVVPFPIIGVGLMVIPAAMRTIGAGVSLEPGCAFDNHTAWAAHPCAIENNAFLEHSFQRGLIGHRVPMLRSLGPACQIGAVGGRRRFIGTNYREERSQCESTRVRR